MKKKVSIIYAILIIFFSYYVASTPTFNMDLGDTWTWAGGGSYDNLIWNDYGTTEAEIDNWNYNSPDDADAICFDYDVNDGTFDECFYDSTSQECNGVWDDFDEGCANSCISGYYGSDIDVTTKLDSTYDVIYAKTFYHCDNTSITDYSIRFEQYVVYDRRRTDCVSSGSNSFYLEARRSDTLGWEVFETNTCSSLHNTYWGCATWDEDDSTSATGGMDEDPCKIKDGSVAGNACSSTTDCISQVCDGAQTKYKYNCYYDGSIDIYKAQKDWMDSCGGEGYVFQDWIELYNYDCNELNGSGYVCDEAHEGIEFTNFNGGPSPCRKNIGESCSVTTDCWNDDGGSWCNTISECTDGANGRDCGSDSDCDSGRCDSTCMAKLSDGQSCNENSDCINNTCISGYCGGPPASFCNGTLETNTQDSEGESLDGSYVYLNGILEGTTNYGQKILTLYNYECGVKQNISVYCSNNQSRLCGSKTSSIDFDGDHDSLFFDCNKCNNNIDLIISSNRVKIDLDSGSTYNISVNITTENINAPSGVKVAYYIISKETGLVNGSINSTTSPITASTDSVSTSINMDMKDINFVYVSIDPDKIIAEPKDNNFAVVPFVQYKLRAYLDVSTGNQMADNAIKEFLEMYIHRVDYQIFADVTIAIGKNNSFFSTLNSYVKNSGLIQNKWYYENKNIYYNQDNIGNLPYNGIVGGFNNGFDSKKYILAYGKDIDGDVAAVKQLISHSDLFLSKQTLSNEKTVVIDKYDGTGIAVYDLMHNNENKLYYLQESNNFKEVISKILNDNNYEISIKTVKTTNDNTTLRLKNVNSDYSNNYKDAVVENSQPVVLAHGIHSDLNTWSDFGQQLAENGRDTWLIEMYGGPTTECDTCPVYTFDDLRYYYWPALIAGVEHYSGQNTLQYVGYDLGCTVALESLENYSNGKNNAGYYFDYADGKYKLTDLAASPIDTFVGVACIGNFSYASNTEAQTNNALPLFADFIKEDPELYNQSNPHYGPKFNGHIPGYYYKTDHYVEVAIPEGLIALASWLAGGVHPPLWIMAFTYTGYLVTSEYQSYLPPLTDNKISTKVYEDLISWINNSNVRIGENVNLNNIAIIEGVFSYNPKSGNREVIINGTDKFVSDTDQKQICQNINSDNKYYVGFENLRHFTSLTGKITGNSLPDNPYVKKIIIIFIAQQYLTQSSFRSNIISTNTNCGG